MDNQDLTIRSDEYEKNAVDSAQFDADDDVEGHARNVGFDRHAPASERRGEESERRDLASERRGPVSGRREAD